MAKSVAQLLYGPVLVSIVLCFIKLLKWQITIYENHKKLGLLKFLSSSLKILILRQPCEIKLSQPWWLVGVVGGTMELLDLASGWDDCTVLWCFAEVIQEDNRGQGVRLQSFASLVTQSTVSLVTQSTVSLVTQSTVSLVTQSTVSLVRIYNFASSWRSLSSPSGHSSPDQRCLCMMIGGWWCAMMRPITGWSSTTAGRHQPARHTV